MIINERYLDRSSKSISEYFKEVSKLPLLTPEEEYDYAVKAQNGDSRAKEELIKSNLRFVISVAKQYQNKNVEIQDLINEGNYGLIEAAGRYDPTRGAKFISYAVHYIQRRVLEFLKETQNIYDIPKSKISKLYKMKRVISRLEGKLGREVYPHDMYSEFDDISDFEVDEVYSLLKYMSISTSQVLGGDDGDFTLGDTLESSAYDDILESEETLDNLQRLSELIDKLPLRLREPINEIYGLDGNEELGKKGYANKIGVSVERVGQIHNLAVRCLRGIARGRVIKFDKEEPTRAEVLEKVYKRNQEREALKRAKHTEEVEGVNDETSIMGGLRGLFKKIF
jgi:RNA polymerase primary sigma factor